METRTIRGLAVLLPGEDPEDLEPIDGLPRDSATVNERIVIGDAWTRAHLTGVVVNRCWLVNADLASVRLEGVTLDRCVLRGCTLVGANLTDATLKNVIFENCRLDYATFSNVRASGPVAFLGCSLAEATLDRCKLTSTVFDGCKLAATTFEACDLRGADMRGNDLSKTVGITSLRGATLSPEQLPGVTEAIIHELDLKIKA